MFNLSLTTYLVIIILLLVIYVAYNCNEHFAEKKKKKIHMMKVKKPGKFPSKPSVKPHVRPPIKPNVKPPVNPPAQDATNADLYQDKKKHHHHHHYYEYSYPNYWYEYLYPRYWLGSWWGYPSVYDPKLSVPYVNDQPIVNFDDNCHKKCMDRYENEVDTDEYSYKVDNCINEYCY
jgi:hypothetical protein